MDEGKGMMKTIEEQFVLLRESIMSHINGPDEDKPYCKACDERIRAALTAVLEDTRPNIRARIAALGADTARQEQVVEREMVQAQTPVVNEDGER